MFFLSRSYGGSLKYEKSRILADSAVGSYYEIGPNVISPLPLRDMMSQMPLSSPHRESD